jgi:exodeoxyribonuclease VII small subunit
MVDPKNEPGFDELLKQLRGVVEKLESGNLTLEQSLSAFEDGVRLSRKGAQILDAAEKRVELLQQSQTDPAQSELVPFDAPAAPK